MTAYRDAVLPTFSLSNLPQLPPFYNKKNNQTFFTSEVTT